MGTMSSSFAFGMASNPEHPPFRAEQGAAQREGFRKPSYSQSPPNTEFWAENSFDILISLMKVAFKRVTSDLVSPNGNGSKKNLPAQSSQTGPFPIYFIRS